MERWSGGSAFSQIARAQEEGFGLLVAPLIPVEQRQVIENDTKIKVIGAERVVLQKILSSSEKAYSKIFKGKTRRNFTSFLL